METDRPQVALRAGNPSAAIVNKRKAPQMLRTPRRSPLRGVPSCVRLTRKTFIPDRKGGVENLLEHRAFGDDYTHRKKWQL